jgi:class 3 adenylate cyclase
MRPSTGIYILVIAAAFGLSTVLTRTFAPNDNLVASLLDAAFVVGGVGLVELWAWRRRREAGRMTMTPTLVFTDVEASTELARKLRDEWPTVIRRLEGLLRREFEARGGEVVDTQGDALFTVFGRAANALEAAVAAQAGVARAAWPEGARVRVRIGIHTGEAERVGARYLGVAVHRAARVCASANGGQTLASDTTRALAEDDPPRGINFLYLGEHALKGFERPARLWEVVSEQAGVQPRGAARPEATADPFPGRADELAAAAAAALSKSSGRDSPPE